MLKKCVCIHLSILIQLHTWCTAYVCIYMPAIRITHASPYEKEILIPGCTCFLPWLSFFSSFSFSGWANVVGMVLPNVDNPPFFTTPHVYNIYIYINNRYLTHIIYMYLHWKLSSAQRNILLLFASSCLRSPVNWGFRTENQQQKDHVRGLKNTSGNDVTIWYILN